MFLNYKLFSFFLLFYLCSSEQANYYVTYNSSNSCSDLSKCGSESSPFPSLLSAFYYIDSSAEQINANFTDIQINLLYDYYIVDPMNVTYYLNKLNNLYGKSNIFWSVFANIKNINIVISNNNPNQLSTISFRTLNIGFLLNQCGFSLRKIALDFSQANYNRNTALDCLYRREGCCSLEPVYLEDDPCFVFDPQPYSITTYFNFIEIINPFFASVYIFSCEINNLKLPKRYFNFFVKSLIYDSSKNIFFSFARTKIQNITLSQNFLIGSNSFDSPFYSIYMSKYFTFSLSSIDCSSDQSSTAMIVLNNYETVFFSSSNITNSVKLILLTVIRRLYLSANIFLASKNVNSPQLINNYISGEIYKIYSQDNNFLGDFYNHFILKNSGNLYITNNNFTGLKIDKNPFFQLTDTSVLDIKNMKIIFLNVNFKDQNVFDFIRLGSLYVNELNIFNNGNFPLRFFILDKVYSIILRKILVNQDDATEHRFVFFSFKNTGSTIIIANSKLMKASFIFEGIQKIFILLSNFSTNYDISYSIFSFNDQNKIYLHSCNFTKASFKKVGTIFSLGEQNYLLIFKCAFSFLENYEGGTVISASSSNRISIQQSNFSHIFSFDKGGAIFLTENNNLMINNSKIDNITAINSGGFLYASQALNSIWISSSQISNLLSAEGGFILLNYKSFLIFSQSVLRSASVSYFGGAFNFKTSNLALISNCQFETLFSEEAASFMSIIESNKVLVSELKLRNIKCTGAIGNIYMRSKNKIVLRKFDMKNSQSSLFYATLINIIVLKNFIIDTADSSLFALDQSNILLLDHGSIFNYLSSQALFYGSYSNKAIFLNTEITEKVNENIGLVYSIVENNSLKFKKTNFIFLKLIGLVANGRLNQIFFHESKVNIRKVAGTLINILDSKVILKKTSFINEIQDDLSIGDLSKIEFIKLFSIRNSSLFMSQISCNAIKGKRNFEFGTIITSNLYVDNSIFQNDKILSNNSNSLTSKFSALIFRRSSFYFYKITSNDTKISISKSEFYFSLTSGFNISIISAKYHKFFTISILNSFFLKNLNGVLLFYSEKENYEKQMKICRNFFAFNTAEKGSVLKGLNLFSLIFKNNHAFANQAKVNNPKLSKGGVFYFSSNISTFNYSFHEYKSNHFTSNQADAGGVFFLESGFPFLSQEELFFNNNFTRNVAYYYGNHITTSTTTVGLEENAKKIDLPNLVSGSTYPKCFASIRTFDYYKQGTSNNNDNYFDMLNGIGLGETKLDLSQNWNIDKGNLCFGGYLKNAYLWNSTIFWNNITFNYLNKTTSNIFLSYHFRKCTRGEKMTDDFRCTECLRNSYSFTSNIDSFSNCELCNEELGFYCFGGSRITIKSGFWRKNINSTNILACLNKDACLGDDRPFNDNTQYLEEYSVSKCAEGYLNPFCAVCKRGWGLNSSHTCSICRSYEYIVKSICLTLIQFFFLIFAIRKSFHISKGLYTGSLEIENMISMELLKMFSFHAQLLIVIFSLKGSILNIRSIFEVNPFNSNLSDNFSLQCLLQAGNIYLPYYYSKLLVSLNTPFLIILISALFVKILIKKNIGTNRLVIDKIGFLSTLKTLFFVTISLQTSNIIRDCFDGLINVNIADPKEEKDLRLIPDPSISYSSVEFQLIKNFAIIPVIFIIGISFPIFIFLQQFQMKRVGNLETKTNLFLYGYFFYSYKKDRFYWDLAISFRKLLILAIISFSKNFEFQNGEAQLISFCLISILLVLILFALNKVKPYKQEFEIVHKAEESSLLVLFLSMTVLLPSMNFQNTVSNQNDQNSLSENVKTLILAIIIYSMNAGFYIVFAFEYVKLMNLKKKALKYLPKRIKTSKIFKSIFTHLDSIFISKKTSFSSDFQVETNKEKSHIKQKSKLISDSNDDLQIYENVKLEKEILGNKKTFCGKGGREIGGFLKAIIKKKELLLVKIQKMALKILSQSEKDIHSKFQIICFEEDVKRSLYKNEQREVKIVYWRADDIVNYKIMMKSLTEPFILNSCELILNTGKESKLILQKKTEKVSRTTFSFSLKIDKNFIYFPIVKLNLWSKDSALTLDLILPLPFLYYIPINFTSNYLLSENELNSLIHPTEQIAFSSSSSFIRRIAILHRFQEFKYRNLLKIVVFQLFTKDGNRIIIFWSPIFGKRIGKITIEYEKEDKKLVGMLRNMMEIKNNE